MNTPLASVPALAAVANPVASDLAAGLPAGPRHRRSALVIGHRGASGYRPEHTLAAYELAIRMGADAIEPDLVLTRDGVLVARHENEIGHTTDVALRPEFAARRTTKTVDGRRLTGWFTEDFTLAELKSLRATERLGDLRPTNRLYDGRWSVVTLTEIVALVRGEARREGRPVGLVLELKHSSYFAARGTALEPILLRTLEAIGLGAHDECVPVWVESFETAGLRWLAAHSDLRLVQLIESEGAPADGTLGSYAELLTARGLAQVATYAGGISLRKSLVLDPDAGRSAVATPVVAAAHDAGLSCWVFTLRAENQFLPAHLRRGSLPAGHGDLRAEVAAFVEAGVDGMFVDFPDLAIRPAAYPAPALVAVPSVARSGGEVGVRVIS